MNKKQPILLVDDSSTDIDLMRFAFKKAGTVNPIIEVHNGEEAINYLRGEGAYKDRKKYPLPGAVLLDLNMPKKNGFEVLKWARAQKDFRNALIIVLTSSLRTEDVEQAFDLGATAFLVKPSSMENLITLTRRLSDWLEINQFPPSTEPITG